MTKYRAVRTEVDGIVFASKKEAHAYQNLRLLERAGYVSNIELQPKYPLVVNGKLVCTYIADFRYTDKDGKVHVEDAKGMKTPTYKLKAKLFHALHPNLRIEET